MSTLLRQRDEADDALRVARVALRRASIRARQRGVDGRWKLNDARRHVESAIALLSDQQQQQRREQHVSHDPLGVARP